MKHTELLKAALTVIEGSRWDSSEWCACTTCGSASDEHEPCTADEVEDALRIAIAEVVVNEQN